jgi:tRNA/tmRNA/rRNA uracil-C5-methylase (TrmA/RlmC/RlmD family)
LSAPSPLSTPVAWELVSGDYAKEVVPQFEKYAADALRLAGVEKGSRVVDVACGPGTLTMIAARAGANVSALDFSEKMIAIAKQRASGEGLAVDARVGDSSCCSKRSSATPAGHRSPRPSRIGCARSRATGAFTWT